MRHLRLSGTVIDGGINRRSLSSRFGFPKPNREEIQWPRGGGKMAVSTDGDNFSVFSVAPAFFFVLVGEVSKRFGHIQKAGLVQGIFHALGKANAFRGVPTVIDN
jgi:hypothetical protein